MLKMHKNIENQRFVREMIIRWNFSSLFRHICRKLESLYKNYILLLQVANEIFGD